MNDVPYTIDIVERLKEALKQRTCLWETDIQYALNEIQALQAQVKALTFQLESKEETPVKRSTKK